ncbi:hypothetical protein H6F39_05820 [Anabaena sp. FACHB-1250]|uniref:Uncharacterized protein n=2 Tax=Dolichospermum TaxID=748770 RepID=A0A480AJ44_9CYAN|nr:MULTISPECIES: hypothetical protein [Nostocales]MBD2140910.1 hypothetical protein [Anabaena sp. FACHB-1250]MBD2268301.1 hypothetical protein [Anabaena sp. FACHB-1391]MBE9218786.1 hypothetical protein [Dolichospermum flos-aquae LEGE 04289]GCL43031.1 hypothetical protein NIES80_27420 [Dolichospermum planctonicum]
MNPITLTTAMTTIFLTGALQKLGENFSDVLMQKVRDIISRWEPTSQICSELGQEQLFFHSLIFVV